MGDWWAMTLFALTTDLSSIAKAVARERGSGRLRLAPPFSLTRPQMRPVSFGFLSQLKARKAIGTG